ncbi:unnamed protein product [Peniophora sp. CBMAI 1063]|nr:unnamed protein product [Peniophora sp. CBMAI 1063]
MAEYDLTKTVIPYLDRHLSFPLLAHLTELEIFPAEDVLAAQYELAKGTNMVDYAASLFEQLHPGDEPPAEFAAKRDSAVATNERLQQEAQAVLDVIEKPEVAQALRQDKNQNLAFLRDNYQVTPQQIEALYNFGQFQYSYGNYSGAADYLYHFRVLSTDAEKNLSASWGKLASDILTGKWDTALEELANLRDTLDARAAAPALASDSRAGLYARAWLLHWSLFVYFNHPTGRQTLLETFLAPAYLNTIQSACPWVLRYLAVAAVLARGAPRSRYALKDVVRVVSAESYQYSDPVTRFLTALYTDFDFSSAQAEMAAAEALVADDFFLSEFRAEFVENARYLVSEAYCRIHTRIDLGVLSGVLNMEPAEGEKWIVNLIRDTKMGADAKIDLEKNVIAINRPAQPVYQTVIEKTRGLALRTQALGAGTVRAPVEAARG